MTQKSISKAQKKHLRAIRSGSEVFVFISLQLTSLPTTLLDKEPFILVFVNEWK